MGILGKKMRLINRMARRKKTRADSVALLIIIVAVIYQSIIILLSLPKVVWLIIGLIIVLFFTIRREVKQKREQRKQEERRKEIIRQGNLEKLRTMSSRQFELYVCDLFRQLGYDADVTPQTGDGGKDIMIYKENFFAIAECKRFGLKTKVTRPQIQKFHSAIIDCKAEKGYIITTGEFTHHAVSYVLDKPIILVNGSKLVEIIEKAVNHSTNEISETIL